MNEILWLVAAIVVPFAVGAIGGSMVLLLWALWALIFNAESLRTFGIYDAVFKVAVVLSVVIFVLGFGLFLTLPHIAELLEWTVRS